MDFENVMSGKNIPNKMQDSARTEKKGKLTLKKE